MDVDARAKALLFVAVASAAATLLACGDIAPASSPADGGTDSRVGLDATTADAVGPRDTGAGAFDTSVAQDAVSSADTAPVDLDAGASVCPSVYSVYGDMDASDNLGDVNPTLYASGTCSGPTEQFSGLDAGTDASFASTDLTITLQQSSLRSGMFVTVIHQTTPFPFDFTTCLEWAGHGTGSMPFTGMPGTIALVNDPENESFPQVQLGTNFAGTDLLFDVSPTLTSMFTLNTVTCSFTKN